MKRRLSVIMLCIMVFLQLPIHASALGGVVFVTLKSGLPGVEDVELSCTGSATVNSEEDFVNGKFIRRKFGDTVYTIYKASDPPESFGRTDLLCWKVTSVEDGSYSILRPGDTVSDHGKGGEFILEAIWDGLEHNSYAFSSPQSVTVTENSVTTRILFTLSGLSLGSAERLGVTLHSGEFSDGENSIQYEYETGTVFSKIGETSDCMIRISEDEWAKAKAGRYTAALQYDADFYLAAKTIRELHGSVPMTLQVGHDVTVSCNVSGRGTASASAAMAREGETVTLAASPAGNGYGLRSWSVVSGGVTVNDDDTFVMGSEDVSVTACFDPLHLVNFRNYDNSVLYSDRFFQGDTPVYKGETPVKPSDGRYGYVFTGWDPQPGPVYESKDYTAQFRREYRNFASFNANGGSGTMADDSYYASEGTYTLPSCGFTAPEGYLFKDWTVTWETKGGAVSSTTCMAGSTLTGLTGDITVSANWIELTLKASPSHAGDAEYVNGAFTAKAKQGYTFDHWEYSNDAYSMSPAGTVWPSDNPYQPAEVSYKIYTAVFTANEYTLTIQDGIQNGTVEYSGTPKTDNTIRLTVIPDEGYQLASLSYKSAGRLPVNITKKDANGRYFFTMPPENITVTAVFVPVYAITTDGAAQAYWYDDSTGQAFPVTAAAEGTQLFLELSDSAVPEEGSYFTGEFTVNGTNLGREDSGDGLISRPVNTFTMPGAAVDVAAVRAARENLALSFVPGETRSLPAEAWIQLQSVEGEPPLIWYDEARRTKVLDVNRDGRPDLGAAFGDDARSVSLTRLADCDAFGRFTLAFSGPADRFGTIAFTIPERAFGPASFTIPSACTSIEKSTFEETTALTVVDASHVTAIGPDAFSGCTGLTQIRLPADCTIDASAFTGCGTVFVFAPADGTTESGCEGIANCIFVEESQH